MSLNVQPIPDIFNAPFFGLPFAVDQSESTKDQVEAPRQGPMNYTIEGEIAHFKTVVLQQGLITIVRNSSLLPPVLRGQGVQLFAKGEVTQLLGSLIPSICNNQSRVFLGGFVRDYELYQSMFEGVAQDSDLGHVKEALEACKEFTSGFIDVVHKNDFSIRYQAETKKYQEVMSRLVDFTHTFLPIMKQRYESAVQRSSNMTEEMHLYALGSIFWEQVQHLDAKACQKIRESSPEVSKKYFDYVMAYQFERIFKEVFKCDTEGFTPWARDQLNRLPDNDPNKLFLLSCLPKE